MNIYNTKDFNDVFNATDENFNFFNDSFLSRLSACQNFNNFTSLSTLFAFDQSNSIDEKSD